MSGLIKTRQVREALSLAQQLLTSDTRIGRILGEPGTGKTAISKLLPGLMSNCVRVCVWDGITQKSLLQQLANALTVQNEIGTTDALMKRCINNCADKLILVDEANHLRWHHLEKLRYLADEGSAAILLVGTELQTLPFKDNRTRTYLAQMARRIGTKQMTTAVMTKIDEIGAYVLKPRFNQISKEAAKQFKEYCGGYWGEAIELVEACERIMHTNNIDQLTLNVVESAHVSLADRRTA